MTIKDKCIYADEGLALRTADMPQETDIVTVSVARTEQIAEWEDCPHSSDEATEADKDAALRRFGVEVDE